MRDIIDDRSPDERLIATALAAGPAPVSGDLDGSQVLALAHERIASRSTPKPNRWATPVSRRVAGVGVALALLIAMVPIAGTLLSTPAHHVRIVSMSWAYAYGSIAEIGAASDLVVVGTVTGVLRVDHPAGVDLPQTVFSLSVERTLKGDPGQGVLPVLQDGGQETADTWAEAEDFPLMATGDHVLLFLRPMSRDGATEWAITGGPQGRLLVAGDRVTTTPTSLVLPIPTPFTVDQVAAALAANP
jgi:hypothetical protein